MAKAILSVSVALLATAPVLAVGNARIVNKCNVPVTIWSVGKDISQPFTLAGGSGSYSEQFVKDPVTGGKALKIAKDSNGLYNGAPQTIFAYNLDGDKVWYDLSDVFGDAFSGSRLLEASTNPGCPRIDWSNGTPPAGSQTKLCGSGYDVTLTLCA